MSFKTVHIGTSLQGLPLAQIGMLPATSLPLKLGYPDVVDIIHKASLKEPDLKTGSTGIWVVDPSAKFAGAPIKSDVFVMKNRSVGGWNMWPFQRYVFKVGRSDSANHLILDHPEVSRQHLEINFLPGIVSLRNLSHINEVYVGGGILATNQEFTIRVDAPLMLGIKCPGTSSDGLLLISPLDNMLTSAIQVLGPAEREPWYENVEKKQENVIGEGLIPHQAIDTGQAIITPTQIKDADDLIARSSDRIEDEGIRLRSSIRDWIYEGRLDRHVRGEHNWDQRLLANVRKGGMLLPTHSTDTKSAVAILMSGQIDPKYFSKNLAFFRYGFGHSYGEIVFIQRPGVENLGRIKDLWRVMDHKLLEREDLFRLAGCVDYNRSIPTKPVSDEAKDHDGPAGRTYMIPNDKIKLAHDQVLMELFPQHESDKCVSLANTYVVLVPEHLYDDLIKQIPENLHELIVCIPGTGSDRQRFLEGRDKVARRSRVRGGTYEPKIGYDALFRYEIVYFKLVEMVQRFRHHALRNRMERFAIAATKGQLTHAEIEERIREIATHLPEAFHVLRLKEQNPSHDGKSPLGHSLNALLEAAYLAPALREEFEDAALEDAFFSLLFHDEGKVYGAKKADHGIKSIEMAKHHLKLMGIDGEKRDRILEVIEKGGLISELSMAIDSGKGYKSVKKRVLSMVSHLLPEVFLMNFADMASIPGRSDRKMLVNINYRGVIDARPNLISAFRMLLE